MSNRDVYTGFSLPQKVKLHGEVSIPATRSTPETSSRALACTLPATPIPTITIFCSNRESPQHLTRLHLVPARVGECALPTPDLRSRVALWLFIGPALGRQVYSSRTEFIELSACMACGIAAHGLQR